MARLRRWILAENRLGSLDPEIYPMVVVTLGTAGWAALVLLRKTRDLYPIIDTSTVNGETTVAQEIFHQPAE